MSSLAQFGSYRTSSLFFGGSLGEQHMHHFSQKMVLTIHRFMQAVMVLLNQNSLRISHFGSSHFGSSVWAQSAPRAHAPAFVRRASMEKVVLQAGETRITCVRNADWLLIPIEAVGALGTLHQPPRSSQSSEESSSTTPEPGPESALPETAAQEPPAPAPNPPWGPWF